MDSGKLDANNAQLLETTFSFESKNFDNDPSVDSTSSTEKEGRGGFKRDRKKHLRKRSQAAIESGASNDALTLVKCAKCKEVMERKCFIRHNYQKHVGLAWIDGEEPINMDDDKLLLTKLKNVLLIRKKLRCETCGVERKSALGFLSHLQCCLKSDEERAQLKKPCEACGRLMLPSSLQTHKYTVHNKQEKPLVEKEWDGTTKRKAAIKAATFLQHFTKQEECLELNDDHSQSNCSANDSLYIKVPASKVNNQRIGQLKRMLNKIGRASCNYSGCDFTSSVLKEMTDHLEICIHKTKEHYSCQICSFQTQEEVNILSHIENEHCHPDSEVDTDSPSTSLEEEDSLFCTTPDGSEVEVGYTYQKSPESLYNVRSCLSALKFTLEHQQQHYQQYLFPSLHTTLTDWVQLSEEEAQEYLPETKESMFFTSHNHNLREKNLQNSTTGNKKLMLFEGDVQSGNPIFFVGGPVWCLTWCPLPLQWTIESYAQINQLIAVSCHKNMEDTYCMGRNYAHKGLIQIWNLGHLNNKSEGKVPVFGMGIAHEYGTIWCMEWCPSGCYDMQERNDGTLLRIGLLAAACSDGSVRVYSVCDPTQLRNLKKKVIAAGFTNGLTAVWRLDSEAQLLNMQEGKSQIILPYKITHVHNGAVIAVAFTSWCKEPRYLLTESIDHTIKSWDLEESHNPRAMNKRGYIGTYDLQLTDWMSSLNGHHSSFYSFRSIGNCVSSTTNQNSIIWTLAANPWINAIAEATKMGELSVTFVHHLHHRNANKGKKSKRMMINCAGLLELKKCDFPNQENVDNTARRLSNSFNLNNNCELQRNSIDSDHKNQILSKSFNFAITTYEDSLILQGKGEHEFIIEFLLEENETKQCLKNDTTLKQTSNNNIDDSENDFGDGSDLNENITLRKLFHESESMKATYHTYDPKMCIENVEEEVKEEEKIEEGEGKEGEVTNNMHSSFWFANRNKIYPNEGIFLPHSKPVVKADFYRRYMKYLSERWTNDFQRESISTDAKLYKNELSDFQGISKATFNTVTSEQHINLKEDCKDISMMSALGASNKIVQDYSLISNVKVSSSAIKEEHPIGNLASSSSNLCNIVSQSNKRATECMANSVFDQQHLKQSGTDRKIITINKQVQNNSDSYVNIFSADANTQDLGSELLPATKLAQEIPALQKSKINKDIFKDSQPVFKGMHSEQDQTDDPENTALSASNTSKSCIQKEKSSNNYDSKGNIISNDESSMDIPKLEFSNSEVETYDHFASNYELIFYDFPKDNTSDPPTENRSCTCQSNALRSAKNSVYPILSINRVAWNPNCHSFLWLAAGCQNGFVRTSCITAAHTQMMDDIFRKAAWNMNHQG